MMVVLDSASVSTRRNLWLQCGGLVSEPASPRVTGWRLPASVSPAMNGASTVRPLGSAGRICSSGIRRDVGEGGAERRDQPRAVGLAVGCAGVDEAHIETVDAAKPFGELGARRF